jgi:hypothetical protein
MHDEFNIVNLLALNRYLYLLFFLIKKVTKKSRLQKNRLKFTAFRYAEIAKHQHRL